MSAFPFSKADNYIFSYCSDIIFYLFYICSFSDMDFGRLNETET